MRPSRGAATSTAIGGLLGGAAVVLLVVGASAVSVAVIFAAAAAAFGCGMVLWAHAVAPGEPDTEERHQRGPDLRQRRIVLRSAIAAGAALFLAGAVPAYRRVDEATSRLRGTRWADGIRVVDDRGNPVHVNDTVEGQLLTVFPDGATDAIDSQAVLLREASRRFAHAPGREDWAPEGIVAYSKLCTHMACPVGLYESDRGTLLCPCHQAVFDPLDGGRSLRGPARRSLPQLPLDVDDEGYLVARGDFSDSVGTGFWGRP